MTETAKTKQSPPPWPDTIRSREQLDRALEDGLKSGVSPDTIADIVESAKARLKNG
jgi:hypothetical protein